MADTGDHAYSYALAVLGDPDRAAHLASAAVRRGGRATTLVLAHVHREAMGSAAIDGPGLTGEARDPNAPAPEELGALARALTATRPAGERAVIELDGRHGLDRVRLGRILGCSADDAAARVAAVAATWQQALDPVLLVRLGPGSCPALAELLASRGLWTIDDPATAPSPTDPAATGADSSARAGKGGTSEPGTASATAGVEASASVAAPSRDAGVSGRPAPGIRLGDLLAAAEPVGAHAESCPACADRLRAIVSVRDLVSGAPLETAPELVRVAARSTRFRPAAVFPPVDGHDGGRLRARATAGIAVLIALLLAGGLTVVLTGDDDGSDGRVAALAKVPTAGGDLEVRPAVLRANPLQPMVLRNEGDSDISWRIETGVEWLTATPSEGMLAAGKGVSVQLRIGDDAPEGDVRTAVNVVGDDGSTASVKIETSVERPPDVDASASYCSVTAAVEDESEIASVFLHYRRGTTDVVEERRLFESDRGFTGSLPLTQESLTWWVTATDARGNITRGTDSLLPDGCAPPSSQL